jgi:ferredoxin-NADP reductase
VTREQFLGEWTGETAYVQHALVKYIEDDALVDVELPAAFERFRNAEPAVDADARVDPSNVEVYACGINAMVYGLVDAVERLGVPDRYTHFEGFG